MYDEKLVLKLNIEQNGKRKVSLVNIKNCTIAFFCYGISCDPKMRAYF